MRSRFTTEFKVFCRVMAEEREEAGLTQAELSRRLGKPQSFVSKYERGERRLDVAEFIVIARAMDRDPAKMVRKVERLAKTQRG